MMRPFPRLTFALFLTGLTLVTGAGGAKAEVRIVVDPATRHQTIRAWETTANLLWDDGYAGYADAIFDRLIEEVGITRIRLEAYAGDENPGHATRAYLAGDLSAGEWREQRYVTVNDNADPFVIDPAGFDFADLDWRIDHMVLPLMEAAARRGKRLDVSFCYVAFTGQNKGGDYIHTNPEEYAEFMLAVFQHMRDRYNLTPDTLEVLLEPDLVKEWTPELLAAAMAAAATRLRDAGFTPGFIAPSVTDAGNTVPWFDVIAKNPVALGAMVELSYHRYWGASRDNLAEIAARAKTHGLTASMLEFWGGRGTHDLLFEDLTIADAGAWQSRTVTDSFTIAPGMPSDYQLRLQDDLRYVAQYSRYLPPGSTRIGLTTEGGAATGATAFDLPAGGQTVVVEMRDADLVSIKGLRAGDYYVSYATEVGTTERLDPVAVAEGRPFAFQMPAPGVLTVTSGRP